MRTGFARFMGLVHHPLIFSPLKRIVEDHGSVGLMRRMIREGRSLIALHTNLDIAREGLNTYVANKLGLKDQRPLVPSKAKPLLKLVVFVPETHVDAVRDAICDAGAGHIGRYDQCTFSAPGTGTFRPQEGTNPFIGSTGQLERVGEIRLETVLPQAAIGSVLIAMFKAHPYEEVAYDLYPLENAWPGAGLGRIGTLLSPMSVTDFMEVAGEVFSTGRLAYVGDGDRLISTIALCTGSGGDQVEDAVRAGADLYLTGELKHSHALLARELGIAVITAGHFATERPAVDLLTEYLTANSRNLQVVRAEETDPLQC